MTEPISSRDNQYIKLIRSLESKKGRSKSGLFLIEGIRSAGEALAADWQIDFILVAADKAEQPEIAALLSPASERGVKVFPVEPHLFASVAVTEESQGVLLAARLRELSAERFGELVAGGRIALLDGLQDPGNVGTIMRTAWAAGLSGLILVNNSADIYNPKVVRATMGALYNLPVVRMDNETARAFLESGRYQLTVADADGTSFRDFTPAAERPLAWLLGSEGNGVSDFWRARADNVVSIPMAPGVESLNVAVAAGILFFSC